MGKKIKVVDVAPEEPVQEVEQPVEEEINDDPPVEEVEEIEVEPPTPPPKKKVAKAKTKPEPIEEESEAEEIPPPPPKKKTAKAKAEPTVKVTTLIPCPKCGKKMTAKTLEYSHSSVCGVAAKAAPKPKPKAEVREEATAPAPQVSYHDVVRHRVQQMREQREHRLKSLCSKAV